MRRRISGDQRIQTPFPALQLASCPGRSRYRILASSYSTAPVPEVTRAVPRRSYCKHRPFTLRHCNFSTLDSEVRARTYQKTNSLIGGCGANVISVQVLAFSSGAESPEWKSAGRLSVGFRSLSARGRAFPTKGI